MPTNANPKESGTLPSSGFLPWVWIPLMTGGGGLLVLLAGLLIPRAEVAVLAGGVIIGLVLAYFLVQGIARLFERRWSRAVWALVRFIGLSLAGGTVVAVSALVMAVGDFLGPSEDGFADGLTIPPGLDVAEPLSSHGSVAAASGASDPYRDAVSAALSKPGGGSSDFVPSIPSLRAASTDHPAAFFEYLEASPDWSVFLERGNRFAKRSWSENGEPKDTLHGYISEFGGPEAFQTRCLLCLDRKQWSRYRVQQVQEGAGPVSPRMGTGNGMHESRVMIECGGVWVEIFEQSMAPERRVTKATLNELEAEFSQFVKDPSVAVKDAKDRSRDLARRLAGPAGTPLELAGGLGMYEARFSLNPAEAGAVYLKAYEATKGTPLSVDRLRAASETRMAWSIDPSEVFGAKVGFTIYEGDWDKPYAARFEVWFVPDAGGPERKLAERNFKIEGWQR